MKYDITIKGKSFIGDPTKSQPDPNQPFGKVDHNALGFGWRPGRKKESVLIEDCTIDANGVA